MVYKHIALIEVEPDKKVELKPGKQNSEVEFGKRIVEEDGKRKVEGKKYKLIKNIELPFAMTEEEVETWKNENEEVQKFLREKEKSLGA